MCLRVIRKYVGPLGGSTTVGYIDEQSINLIIQSNITLNQIIYRQDRLHGVFTRSLTPSQVKMTQYSLNEAHKLIVKLYYIIIKIIT